MNRLRVGILGATGMVGQQFVRLLENHPWFEVVCLAASPHSAGQPYSQAVTGRWKLSHPQPTYVDELVVQDVQADFQSIVEVVDVVFCALAMDKAAIRELETAYADAGVAVISNNSAHRGTPDVPMLIPEVNLGHTKLIDSQRTQRGWTTGLIALKPNCSIQSYVITLSALQAFQPTSVHVTSLQAVSGAGRTFRSWPEITDNLIPFIDGEEEKSEHEPLQIWGTIENNNLSLTASPLISATCIRVPVSDGHLADVSVNFQSSPSKAEILAAFDDFAQPLADLKLPSSPKRLIHYTDAPDRPQPKLDRDCEGGMGVTVGRLHELPAESPYDWRFVSLAHNTIRGAAGGAILMAELLVSQDYIKGKNGGF